MAKGRARMSLFERLQGGPSESVAEPSVYPCVDAFNDHAIAFLHCAATLCKERMAHDFAVFGALYCIRHALELWLKCIIQKRVLDSVVEAVNSGADVDALVEITLDGLPDKERQRKRRSRREQVIKALCVVRNVENGLSFPLTHQRGINERSARARVAQGKMPRKRLATAWPIPVDGHDLQELWGRAKPVLLAEYPGACANAASNGLKRPLDPSAIEEACELFSKWDADGDGFRYPSSLYGEWYVNLPSVNLKPLGQLARSLQHTITMYPYD